MKSMTQDIRFNMLIRKRHNGNIKNIGDINKLLFCTTTGDVMNNRTVGIDFQKKELFYNINPIRMTNSEPSVVLQDKDIEMLKDMILYFKISEWDQFYDEGNDEDIMDGYGWSLWIVENDGTVEVHKGSGTRKSLVTPNTFEEFEKILLDLAIKENMKD